MAWTCPTCGFEANEDGVRTCMGGCGYIKFSASVSLVSPETGKRIRLTIDTVIGKQLLRSATGEDYVYASDAQFKVFKDVGLAQWVIQHIGSATNPTFYKGSELGADPVPLEHNTVVSIGPDKVRLSVEFDSEEG